jgi:hypothetical protein
MRNKYSAEPAEPATIKIEVNGEPIAEPVRQALNQASAADAAAEALKAQIAALKRGEAMQHQQAEVAAKAAEWQAKGGPTHSELLDHWEKLHGMPRTERLFLEEHPELVDNRELTAQAALEAHEQGLERGTEQFNQAVLAGFHRHLQGAQRQVERPAAPMIPAAPERDRSSFVSAPVSREAGPSADGYSRPGRVILTAEERQFARQIGLSETEYAKQKQRLVSMQLSGEAQR